MFDAFPKKVDFCACIVALRARAEPDGSSAEAAQEKQGDSVKICNFVVRAPRRLCNFAMPEGN